MADPIKSVDISRLQECNPDLMEGLRQPQLLDKMHEVLKGSDLQFDDKTQEIIASDKATKIKDVVQQADMVRGYISAAGGDNELTIEDAKAFIAAHEEFSSVTPDAFLADAKLFIEKRWGIVCDHLKQYSMEFPLQNLVDNLNRYNDGVYKEEFEQGRMSFSLLKSALNLVSWPLNFVGFGLTPLEKSPLKAWDLETGREKKIDATYLSGDNLAMEDAYKDHLDRTAAIQLLVDVLNKDIAEKKTEGVAWNAFRKPVNPEQQRSSAQAILKLLEGVGESTIKVERLDGSTGADVAPTVTHEIKMDGSKAAKILRKELAFEDLFDLLMTADKDKRYEKALSFAEGERPGFMGFSGGHSGVRDWDHLVTANVSNLYYAKSILETVIREGNPGQQQKANNKLYREIIPTAEGPHATDEGGGSLGQKILWVPSAAVFGGINTVLGTNWHPIPYRAMSDEEAMYAPERMIRAGVLVWGGPKALRAGERVKASGAARLEAWRAAGKDANIMQRGAVGMAWGADKLFVGMGTARPIRKAMWKWWTRGDEFSQRANTARKTWDIFGKTLAWGAAIYKFDEYSTPLSTDRHGPNLDLTSRAQDLTLDPLPPVGQAPVKK